MKTIFQSQLRHWRATVFFLTLLATYVALKVQAFEKIGAVPQLVVDAVATLCVVAFVHLLDRLFLGKDLEERAESIKGELNKKIEEIISASKSLESMNASGIIRIYESRHNASEDMQKDLTDPKVTKIRLIGVSLNDFIIADKDAPLRKAWFSIVDALNSGEPGKYRKSLDVKLLIMDPECFAAQERLRAETSGSKQSAPRLAVDVNHVANILKRVKEDLKATHANATMTFDCRLYRPGPQLFLCWTDAVCYVEQYYFWDRRDEATPTPTLKFRQANESSKRICPMHTEMEKHFDWIWTHTHASISLEDFLNKHSRGFDKGMWQAAATNVFMDRKLAWQRIITLLKGAKSNIDMQGISLHSFFGPEKANLVSSMIEKKDLKLRVLFINRTSDQAKWRSFREHLLKTPDEPKLELSVFLGDPENHLQSDLCRNTHEAIQTLKRQIKAARKKKGGDWECSVLAAEYESAPVGFILRVDDTVLFEPYHYGKINPSGETSTLGKDMPLFEFSEKDSQLYEEEPERRPFGLLKDHFEFAWEYAKPIDLGNGSVISAPKE